MLDSQGRISALEKDLEKQKQIQTEQKRLIEAKQRKVEVLVLKVKALQEEAVKAEAKASRQLKEMYALGRKLETERKAFQVLKAREIKLERQQQQRINALE